MVVILDLGDGLTEAEAERLEQSLEAVRTTAHAVWTSDSIVPAGSHPLPAHIYAYVENDGGAPCPVELGILDTADTGFLDYVSRHAGDEFDLQPHTIMAELRGTTDAVALERRLVRSQWRWAAITRAKVLTVVEAPTTPETIESYLALDVERLGRDILRREMDLFECWSEGEVYQLAVVDVITGNAKYERAIYDSPDFPLIRSMVDDLVLELTTKENA